MRIVDVRPGNEQEDITAAKAVVKMEIDHPAKSVMIIRGDDPATAQFADRVGVRSDAFPWREAVWLKVRNDVVKQILSAEQYAAFFSDNETASAVVLDFTDTVSSHLNANATLMDIETAYLDANA